MTVYPIRHRTLCVRVCMCACDRRQHMVISTLTLKIYFNHKCKECSCSVWIVWIMHFISILKWIKSDTCMFFWSLRPPFFAFYDRDIKLMLTLLQPDEYSKEWHFINNHKKMWYEFEIYFWMIFTTASHFATILMQSQLIFEVLHIFQWRA